MYRLVFFVLALSASQAFGQTCTNVKSCVRNMNNLEETFNDFINEQLETNESKLTDAGLNILKVANEFKEEVDSGPEECRYMSTNVRRTLLYFCGVQSLDRGSEIEETKKFIDGLPEDILTNNTFRQRTAYCPKFVKFYNFVCKRMVEGAESLLNCDVKSRMQEYWNTWSRCAGNFNSTTS